MYMDCGNCNFLFLSMQKPEVQAKHYAKSNSQAFCNSIIIYFMYLNVGCEVNGSASDTNSPMNSGDEDGNYFQNPLSNSNLCFIECIDAPIIVPDYDEEHLVEDFGCINVRQTYIAAARQFVKTHHPPIRLFKPIIKK